jgi:3-hydroxy-9,10-secoandrosta-1,3,5(10)-triene-9,17-dione monooxygenase
VHPPFPSYGKFNFSSVAVGAAYAAVEYFIEAGASSTRLATLHGGHIQLAQSDYVACEFAEAAGELDMARLLIEEGSKRAAERARTREFATAQEVATDLRDNALITRIALRNVQKMASLVGSKSAFPDHPVSRALRDVETVSHHVTLNWRQLSVGYLAAMLAK